VKEHDGQDGDGTETVHFGSILRAQTFSLPLFPWKLSLYFDSFDLKRAMVSGSARYVTKMALSS
jgi:hypothetical protein